MIATGALSFYANYLYFNFISKHESYLVSALIFSSPFFTLILAYYFLDPWRIKTPYRRFFYSTRGTKFRVMTPT